MLSLLRQAISPKVRVASPREKHLEFRVLFSRTGWNNPDHFSYDGYLGELTLHKFEGFLFDISLPEKSIVLEAPELVFNKSHIFRDLLKYSLSNRDEYFIT